MYTPTDDINLCPGGYVRYYNPCNDINHDLGGVIILVLGWWGWYESCPGVCVCVCVCVCGDGAINLVLRDEWGGGIIIHYLGEWGWYTSRPGGRYKS